LFPRIFRLPSAEVSKRVAPFIRQLQDVLSKIPQDADPEAYFKENNNTPPYFDSLMSWRASKSQLKKIAVISQMVSSYNEKLASSMRPFETYRELVNEFLKDSGKSINIGSDGRSVAVKIKGVKGEKSLSALSSGEAQIFVILTNLSFSPAAQKANVFIIDEPELSLHLRWQEMFVDSVMSANNSTQFIMATHSPSIILERTSNCIDVVAKRNRSRRD
jgi:predicted ATP-binding protein involved in virulence